MKEKCASSQAEIYNTNSIPLILGRSKYSENGTAPGDLVYFAFPETLFYRLN